MDGTNSMEAAVNASNEDDAESMRVCDRCIKKKVKCDRQRPTCSRCREVSLECTYGSMKHKPGPARGSRRMARATKVQKKSRDSGHPNRASNALERHLFEPPKPVDRPFVPQQPHDSGSAAASTLPQLDPVEARNILQRFFDEILPAIPLFGRTKFFSLYDTNLLSYDLILTIVAITAKILSIRNIAGLPQPETTLDLLLDLSSAEQEASIESKSLDMFHREVLLAYYNFHHSPGQRSWMRVSRATRKAYVLGLHQLENPEQCAIRKSGSFTPEEVEEWRSIWWCLYCLDSYVNLSALTPCSIELESMNTALPHCSLDETTATHVPPGPKILLPTEIEELWKTAREVVAVSKVVDFNIHIVTTTMARITGTVLRIQTARPSASIEKKCAALDQSFSAMRLALPPHYLNAGKNALQGETHGVHYLRLTSVLLLNMNRIFISLPPEHIEDSSELHRRWQQVIEASEDVVAVVGQWDTRHSSRIDPAICLIVFLVLGIISLQRRNPSNHSGLQASLRSGEAVLRLFLEQFASIWSLPKYLLEVYSERQRSWPEQVTSTDIGRYANSLQAPIFAKAMQAFPPALPLLGIDTGNNDFNNIFDNWDFDVFMPS